MEEDYHRYRLTKVAPWSKRGTLPRNFCDPKEKNLEGKERVVASYFNHPMKKCFKRANKVFTWMFRQLPKSVQHFTLHKLSDIPHRLKEAMVKIRKNYAEETRILMFASDVKQMFTFLNHDGIREALEWLFKEMEKLPQYQERGGILREPRKINKNKITLVVEDNELYWGSGRHEGRRQDQASGFKDDVITFDFNMLRDIVNLDLKYTHSRMGKALLKQKLGCPIGGILSCFYANLFCSYQENRLLASGIGNKVYGIRQVDDLVMWIAYRNNDHKSLKEANDTQ